MKGHKIIRQSRCAGCLKSIMLFVLLIPVKYLEIHIAKIAIDVYFTEALCSPIWTVNNTTLYTIYA